MPMKFDFNRCDRAGRSAACARRYADDAHHQPQTQVEQKSRMGAPSSTASAPLSTFPSLCHSFLLQPLHRARLRTTAGAIRRAIPIDLLCHVCTRLYYPYTKLIRILFSMLCTRAATVAVLLHHAEK